MKKLNAFNAPLHLQLVFAIPEETAQALGTSSLVQLKVAKAQRLKFRKRKA